jgi:formylglycine-generating enzyme required for sulfatase activity
MELVEGTPLDRVIARGTLPIATALDYASQIAAALEQAHTAGIVHRDVKPANVIITNDGRVKVLDFGLSKLVTAPTDVTVTAMGTRAGVIMGTAAYMSPEQAQGRAVDARSDVFSLGAVLYEMLAGRRPFGGSSELHVLTAILRESPAPIATIRGDVPPAVDRIVRRALEKSPDARYPGAAAMRADLVAAKAALTDHHEPVWRRPSVLVPSALVLASIIAVGTWQTVQARGVRWARDEAIPEIERVQATSHTLEAVRLARRAERYAPEEVARIRQRWTRFTVNTDPAGVAVEAKNYADLDGPWETLGVSPITTTLPFGHYRLRLTKSGYAPIEVTASDTATFKLTPEAETPRGMVRVGTDNYHGEPFPFALSDFWIDRLEVSNRDYKAFVDAGGYRDQKYWKERFVDGDRELSFGEAIARFRDTTGRPGPATWELGTFPEGRGDYPVGGISWFEAAAYARFAGKQLPTLSHWQVASGRDSIFSDVLMLSNFDGKGSTRVGERQGLGPWGTLDMAGNVKEWCANLDPSTSKRYILGGAWDEPHYRFNETDARSPWDRAATFGIRLMTAAGDLTAAEAPVAQIKRDPGSVVPAPDAEFNFYKRFYTYDRTPLDVRVAAIDDSSPDWRKETVSFAAAYGSERVPAHMFLPKHTSPPYQTVVLFPSSYARFVPSSAQLDYVFFDYIIKSGRALIYPVYQGTFERRTGVSTGPNGTRDLQVDWAKDFFRTVDYLETRPDVDKNRLAYYSISAGAFFAPIPLALEPRIKVAAVIAAGLRYNYPPEIQPANFMPHVTIPVLTVNGRDDFDTSLAAQERFLQLVGTPADRKKHVALDGGHIPSDWHAVIREVLDWYDRWLGPVR